MNFLAALRIRIALAAVLLSFLACGFSALAQESPREWTNTAGKKINATLVGPGPEGKVILNFQGKDTAVALDSLSEADREYIRNWQEKQKDREKQAAANATMFAGKELKTGGQVNKFEFDYSPEVLQDKKKNFKAEDTGYRIAITVPEGFDSRKPQKVFILANAQNSQGQSRMGNVLAIGNFNKTCTAEGWVCIAYDSSLGNDVDHIVAWNQAMIKFNQEWPGFNQWTFACGGNSGGAKGAMLHTGYHVSNGRKVVGLFLSSCNQATNMTASADHHKLNKKDLSHIKCLSSAVSNTNKVTPQHMANVKAELRKAGISNFREAWHTGQDGINQEHFAQALRWFAEDGK